ncbi:MAG: hypothetical protein IT426_18480 [Pirellulales bacterium]|nr:hypothetical protein [Pirellulales bacterium]
MDKKESRFILSEIAREYRQKEFSYWEKLLAEQPIVIARDGPSGVKYQIEIVIVWDNPQDRIIRVIISIDDGGFWSSFMPTTDSFVISPDGLP